MKFKWCLAAAAILAASLCVSNASAASDRDQMPKKQAAKKSASSACCNNVQDQIQSLRQDMQGQIDALKADLANKDAQLKQAQQAAADAQAAAAKAEVDATAQQQAVTENAAAVGTLQNNVKDLTGNEASLASTVSDETTNIKKMINEPDAIHFKGITLSPTGSLRGGRNCVAQRRHGRRYQHLVDRHSAGELRSFAAERVLTVRRQSRVALKATGQLASVTLPATTRLTGWAPALPRTTTSRTATCCASGNSGPTQRRASGWDFSGGTGWSLATETTQGLTRGTRNPAGDDRRTIRRRLCLDSAGQLPR